MSGYESTRRPTRALERASNALRGLELTESGEADRLRVDLLSVIDRYLIPRSAGTAGPLNVVFAGPTGSGKSTLINSVMGRSMSPAGFLRPTTSEALVCIGHDNELTISLTDSEIVRGGAEILEDVTFVDTPDIDSTEVENRRRAFEAINAADVIVFVVSASRYADLEPWKLLRTAQARNTPVIHVINRVTPPTAGTLTDYRRRLRREGMTGRVTRIAEHQQTSGDMIPPASVRGLRRAILEEVGSIDVQQNFASTVGYVVDALAELSELALAEAKEKGVTVEQLKEGTLLPDLADRTKTWSNQLQRLDMRRLALLRRDEAPLHGLFAAIRRELRIAIEGQVILRVGGQGLDTQLLAHARSSVAVVIDQWLESLEPVGRFERQSWRGKVRKLSLLVDAVARLGTDANPDLERLGKALREVQSELARVAAERGPAADLSLIDDAVAELRRTRPLAAAVNG